MENQEDSSLPHQEPEESSEEGSQESDSEEKPSEQMEEDYKALLEQQKNFKPGRGLPKSQACFDFAEKYGLFYKGNCVNEGIPLFCKK